MLQADDDTRDTSAADDEGGSDNARSDKDDDSSGDDSDQDASAGDVGSGKDDDDSNGKGGRAGERISTLVSQNKKLAEQNEDLATRMEALETALAKGGAPESKKDARSDDNPAIQKLRKMGYTDEQIEAAKLVYQSVAGHDDSEVKEEMKRLQAKIAANEEKEALNDAIINAKKNGIEVTPKQIADFRKECLTSRDPREQLLAEAPYPRIIKLMLAEGLLEKKVEDKEDAEDDDAEDVKPKRKPEPKIHGGKDSRQEKKPSSKATKYDPGNAMGSLDAIERRVLSRIGSDDDE